MTHSNKVFSHVVSRSSETESTHSAITRFTNTLKLSGLMGGVGEDSEGTKGSDLISKP